MRRVFTLIVLVLCLAPLAACGGPDRDTPEATIASARKVVEQGRADKLGQFIYADSKDMRRLLNRLGVFLGNIQKLGEAVQQKFPKEVSELKARAADAAKSGKATSLLGQMTSQLRPGRGQRKPPDPAQAQATRDAFNDAIKDLFADPYGWLAQSETRLTTSFLTDDSVALLWDGQPVMAPLGMIMKKDTDGKWYFVLPTNVPGISNFMPKTQEQFQIWGSLITVFDKTVLDLTKEVQSGRLHSLEDVSHKAGEMALPPAMIVMLAMGEYDQAKRKEANGGKEPPPKPPQRRANANGGVGSGPEPPADLSKVPQVSPEDADKIGKGEKQAPPPSK
jgi:hypothetical protein